MATEQLIWRELCNETNHASSINNSFRTLLKHQTYILKKIMAKDLYTIHCGCKNGYKMNRYANLYSLFTTNTPVKLITQTYCIYRMHTAIEILAMKYIVQQAKYLISKE